MKAQLHIVRTKVAFLAVGFTVLAGAGFVIAELVNGSAGRPKVTVIAGFGPTLVLASSPRSRLAPGQTVGIDLALTNHQRSKLVVSHLSVRIARIRAPRASAARTCTKANFVVSQLSGENRLTLAPHTTRTLSELMVGRSNWPAIKMLDLPLNQDGCKGASVVLSYAAVERG